MADAGVTNGNNTGPLALDAKYVDLVHRLKDHKRLLDYVDAPTLLQVFGQQTVQIIHDEIVWHLSREQDDENNPGEEVTTRYGRAHHLQSKSPGKDIKVLASMPGGKPLAVDAWLEIVSSFCEHEYDNYCEQESTCFERECLQFCEDLVAAEASNTDWTELNEACEVVRKKVYEQEWEKEPGRPWFFWSMVRLVEDHSVRTSRILARKVFAGGNIPEELVEMVREYYVADKAQQVDRMKYAFEHYRTRWPERWSFMDEPPCSCDDCHREWGCCDSDYMDSEEEALQAALESEYSASEGDASENNMGEDDGGEELASALADNDERPKYIV